jgi:hypothetical protein
MAQANLANAGTSIETNKDSIVIVDNFQSIRGGRTLDVTGFTPAIINAGHVIIKETATGELKPMPISGSAFGALPTGHTYEGILINTIQTAKPMAGVLLRGTVNPLAMPYTVTSILTALKAALPLIDFRADA